ncbi:hypothetical protein Tco_1048514 [Tanacetum coccineum]
MSTSPPWEGISKLMLKLPLSPSAREKIEGNLSALRSLLKEHNSRSNVSSIRLSFDDAEDRTRVQPVVTGKEVGCGFKKAFQGGSEDPVNPEDNRIRRPRIQDANKHQTVRRNNRPGGPS